MRGSEIWGRGALDMKGQVAAEAVAIASLAREGFEPAGDLVFAACADEEVGTGFGLEWLCEEHPDAVRTDFALNEGAGERIELFGRIFYLCSSAEKMSSPFRLLVHGRAGHASVPGIADNALVKAAPLIERLAAYRPELRLGPETAAMIEAVAGRQLEPAEALELARENDQAAAELLEPLLSLTLSPTMISASETRNVIPHLCEVDVDCRLLPGQTQDEVEPVLRQVLGEGDYDLEWVDGRGGTRSELGTPLWSAVESFVAGIEPEATVLPVCVAGFTDSHWLRDAFGTVAYGFFPARTMDPQLAARLIHSADERIEIDDLELGGRLLPARRRRGDRRWLGFSPMAEKIRLGGMALVNGVLVHGPNAWACAVRTDDGELKVAAERKRFRAAEVENPILRGPARLAEVFALLPQVYRRLPEAKLPFQRPQVLAAMGGTAVLVRAIKGSPRLSPLVGELAGGLLSLLPAALALRGGELAAYHGAEHISIGSYEHGEQRAREHERCGSHLLGPLLASSAVGATLAAKAPAQLRGPARAAAQIGAVAASTELFGWMTRNPDNALSRALAWPGHELQHRFATAEPSPEQLEVAEAALAACLELEHAADSN